MQNQPPPRPGTDPGVNDLIRSIRYALWQPMSVIIGYAELLATRPADEQARAGMLEEVRQAAARLAAYMDQLENGEGLELLAPCGDRMRVE